MTSDVIPRRRESSALVFFRVQLIDRQPAAYILASDRMGTLYVGVTSDLVARVWQHREHIADGFTKKYGVTKLVWYELHDDMASAIMREKQIKKWNRAWKVRLIEEENVVWGDLWAKIVD